MLSESDYLRKTKHFVYRKETTEQHYHERVAFLIIFGSRDWVKVRHVNPEVQLSLQPCLV